MECKLFIQTFSDIYLHHLRTYLCHDRKFRTTIATIGIALLGIGKSQGFHEGWIAGAIISGSYFGDKISPLSETTILASSITETPLFRHIRYMLITTIPSLVITLILFTIMGFTHNAHTMEHMTEVAISLENKFNITPGYLSSPS